MMRVKDADRSIHFYRDVLGMDLVRAMHVPGDFTNYFFANLTPAQREAMVDPESAEARAAVKTLWQPVLELTHNHGTEKDDSFHVHTGNSEPLGFGHIGFPRQRDAAKDCSPPVSVVLLFQASSSTTSRRRARRWSRRASPSTRGRRTAA